MIKKASKVILGILIVLLYFTGIEIKNGSYELNSYAATSDWETHWAKDNIQQFIEKGYIRGYSDGTFKPNNSITRAEFVKIFNKAFGLTKTSKKVFNDTKTHWAKTEIDIAVTNGVCNGKSATEFKPNDPITREEAAVMIANYKKIANDSYSRVDLFNDNNQISIWARASLEGILRNGYMGGYSDKTLRPKGQITRAESVVTINRVASNTPIIPKLSTPNQLQATSHAYYKVADISWGFVPWADGYEVYKATSITGPYELITTTPISGWTDRGLTVDSTYYYKVRAYATFGETKTYSDFSSVVSTTLRFIPESVKLNKEVEILTIGQTTNLIATVLPEYVPNKKVKWTSSNNAVAKVDSSGKVTAVGAGKVVITATTIDGSQTEKCNITVNPVNYNYKSNFQKMGFVFQSDTTALYNKNGIKVGLVKRDGFWQLTTQEWGNNYQTFFCNCISIIWGNEVAWDNLIYIDYALNQPGAVFNSPYIKAFVQDDMLIVYVYESTRY